MIEKSKKIFFIESWKTFMKLSVCFLFLVFKVLNDKWSNNTGEKIEAADQQTTTESSIGRAEDCRKDDNLRFLIRVRVGGRHKKVFFETNLTNFLEVFFEDPEQFSLLVWTNDQKEQKKPFFSYWIMKKLHQNFCLFYSPRYKIFR